MSKTQVAQLVPRSSLHQVRQITFRLTLAAFLLSTLVVSTSAQTATEIAMEQGFTIPPGVQTSIVLRAQPDASCGLHEAGVIDPANTMRLYANGEGYIHFHVMPKQESDGRIQLDCTVAGKSISYPVHLATGSSPTLGMPAPQASVPLPQGSRVRPALTASELQQLSDEELMRRQYPPRPDAAAEPDRYAAWLARVSRPMTLLPPHSVSRWVFISYYAWTELLPNQPTEQEIQLVNPEDSMYFQISVNLPGGYGDFTIIDFTQGTESVTTTPLGRTDFNGSEAEWIMERPLVNGTLPELANYLVTTMTTAYALPSNGANWISANTSGAIPITMYNDYYNYPDNDELSFAGTGPHSASINFFWVNYH